MRNIYLHISSVKGNASYNITVHYQRAEFTMHPQFLYASSKCNQESSLSNSLNVQISNVKLSEDQMESQKCNKG